MMKVKFALIGLMSFAMAGMVQAQEWNWPADPQAEARAREYNAAYNDYMNSGEFVAATRPLHWLLQNAPNLNEALYINGVKVYDGAAKEVDSEEQTRIYQDSVITLYNKRAELYNNEEKWIENKAYYAYNFYKGDRNKVADAAAEFERAYELHGTLTYSLAPAYFDLVYRNYAYKGYTADQVLDRLTMVNEILDNAEERGENVANQRSTVEQLVVAMELIDCDFIEDKLGPRLQADPNNMQLAQQVFQYSVRYKCTSTAAFTTALEMIDNDDPTFSTSQVRGMRYFQNKEYGRAIELFEKALGLANTDEQRGDVQYDIARAHTAMNRKSQARAAALRAAELNREKASDAWSLIGNLYMQSSAECRGGQSRVKDQSIFIAAHEAFRRGGDNSGMANARARFPSKEELFTEGFQVGETVNTGCWIGETVTLATRD